MYYGNVSATNEQIRAHAEACISTQGVISRIIQQTSTTITIGFTAPVGLQPQGLISNASVRLASDTITTLRRS
jgi:hypothetical protein